MAFLRSTSKPESTFGRTRAAGISHRTIALSDDQVFFIDSTITSAERERILREDKSEIEQLSGEELKIAEDRMKKLDARTAVAIDAEKRQEDSGPSESTSPTAAKSVSVAAS